jgi:GTPase SAR1 family protein
MITIENKCVKLQVTLSLDPSCAKAKTCRRVPKLRLAQIWDTAGQESFRSITRSYYRGTASFVLASRWFHARAC